MISGLAESVWRRQRGDLVAWEGYLSVSIGSLLTLEVEDVALVVVGGDGLRVEVDHDCAVVQLAQCADAGDRAPVELDLAREGRPSNQTTPVQLRIGL